MKDVFKDKRIVVLYVLVGIVLLIGITYALSNSTIALNINTAIIRLDEVAYGNKKTFDTSNITFAPILDSKVETSLDKVIKIDFTVGGAENNTKKDILKKDIIYDIALTDMNVHCNLLSPYIKWKLIKNGEEISNGSLDYRFDTIVDGRMVLTNTQQDLAEYNAERIGYDNYTFYMWFSDSCQESDLATCVANGQTGNQSNMVGKLLSGKIEVELYTGSKKDLVRKTSDTLDTSTSTCTNKDIVLLNTLPIGSYVDYTGNNGCDDLTECKGQNAHYVNSNNMGYCYNDNYKYITNGWRIGYIKGDKVMLVSAGSPECLSRTISTANETFIEVANDSALKYCNRNYVDGDCTSTDAWALGDTDFYYMTKAINNGYGKRLAIESSELGDAGGSFDQVYCKGTSRAECGRGNDLIDNKGHYWFAARFSASSSDGMCWYPNTQLVGNDLSPAEFGIRIVISLKSSVRVTGGNGTMDDPYTIAS